MSGRSSKNLKILKEIFVWVLSLAIILPFVLILINSFKTSAEADLMNLNLPASFKWENYITVAKSSNMLRAFFNSLLIASIPVAISTISTAMAAFAFSRRRSRFNNVLYSYILLGLILPLNMVPVIRVLKLFKIMGSYQGIILLYSALLIPLAAFLYYGFIASVPKSLDEAALIDGCGSVGLFFKIVLPLLKPVTITVVVVNFMNAWNDFILPLYILNDSKKWGMILTVYGYYGTYISQWNLVCTVIVLTLAPVLAVYVIGQKYIISGMTAGAVKG